MTDWLILSNWPAYTRLHLIVPTTPQSIANRTKTTTTTKNTAAQTVSQDTRRTHFTKGFKRESKGVKGTQIESDLNPLIIPSRNIGYWESPSSPLWPRTGVPADARKDLLTGWLGLCLCCVSVARSSCPSAALRIPTKSLSRNAVIWSPECVADPCPFFLLVNSCLTGACPVVSHRSALLIVAGQ